MFMNPADCRESLRRHSPRVFVDGERIESVADAPQLRPGINALSGCTPPSPSAMAALPGRPTGERSR